MYILQNSLVSRNLALRLSCFYNRFTLPALRACQITVANMHKVTAKILLLEVPALKIMTSYAIAVKTLKLFCPTPKRQFRNPASSASMIRRMLFTDFKKQLEQFSSGSHTSSDLLIRIMPVQTLLNASMTAKCSLYKTGL